ncbi:F0F1 ATP synthase subunit epsilon [Oscillatoriales cyanobacterium LEGE 11467]|uniref:ATP synthase epsilon chain n=1 Tax=Zarconia navalis LEGE 11467 TaxID=1828826 RepID=A0A928Z731_9CYAN|nr:ATP synthase F1 subunit epsilon [Zarconia navalis]MBE9039248.1 F0F1 ATP synthase subunit epsilon [Zarconia navalis LEGE 11467]
MTLNIRVIAPDRTVWDDTAQEIILPSTTGQLGILSGHAPLLTALDIGVMRVRPDKEWVPIALMGGFAEVEEDRVTILVNGAEPGKDIDLKAAREEYEQAQSQFTKSETGTKQEQLKAKRNLKRSRARVLAAGGTV